MTHDKVLEAVQTARRNRSFKLKIVLRPSPETALFKMVHKGVVTMDPAIKNELQKLAPPPGSFRDDGFSCIISIPDEFNEHEFIPQITPHILSIEAV